jgi:hypothetical protein
MEQAMGCVYCFRVGLEDCFKIGRTKNPPELRMKSVSVGSPHRLTLHREVKTNDPPSLERYIHWLLDPHRAENGEFFNVSEEELDHAIEEAESFLAQSVPVLQEAKKLQERRPTNRTLEPSENIRTLHRELRNAERQAFLLEQTNFVLRGRIQVAIGENLGIRGVASWKWREQWKLDQEALRRDEPKVYARFKRLSTSRVFRLE